MWGDIFKSGKRRAAEQASLAGEWERAAQLWVEVGDTKAACDVLLAAAEAERDPQKRLAWLARATVVAQPHSAEKLTILTKRAQFLLALAGTEALDRALRFDLDETASALLDDGDPALALTLFKHTGNQSGIERALQALGSFEELDHLLREEQANRQSERHLAARLSEAESKALAGDRRGALAVISNIKSESPNLKALALRLTSGRARVSPASIVVDKVAERIWFDDTFVIGRNEGQLRLSHAAVSRRHLEISRIAGRTVIRDLQSRNGTYLSGLPIGGPIVLEGRLELALGREALVVLTPQACGALQIEAGGECAKAAFGPYPIEGIGTLRASADGWLELHTENGALILSQENELLTDPVVTLLSGDTFVRHRGETPALEVL